MQILTYKSFFDLNQKKNLNESHQISSSQGTGAQPPIGIGRRRRVWALVIQPTWRGLVTSHESLSKRVTGTHAELPGIACMLKWTWVDAQFELLIFSTEDATTQFLT